MAAIHGSPVSSTIHQDGAADRMRAMDPAKRPFQKRAGTRKRLGAVVQAAMESMAQSYVGVPDQSAGRAGSGSRKAANKLRRQFYSLLDMLAAGQDRGPLDPKAALHQILGIVATQKFATSWERTSQPFIDAFMRNCPREDSLQIFNRLNELEGAVSQVVMDETNRQDVQGVMAVLKRAAVRELARQGISASLETLVGELRQAQPDPRLVARAWFSLEEGVREAAYQERLPPIDYLQGSLEGLPSVSTRVLAVVLSGRVPSHARAARYILETAIDHTPRDPAREAGRERLNTYMVSEAVRLHIVSCMERKIVETVSRFENAVRPGIRTAEVANREWRDIRRVADTLGWIYLHSDWEEADEPAALDAAAEQQFACAVLLMKDQTAAAFLERVDTDRLLAMCAHQEQCNAEQRAHLAGPLRHACEARFGALRKSVEAARSDVDAAAGQDRRIATAHALLALSDALAGCERFAVRTFNPHAWREDTHVDAAIVRAAASLRMAGEPGNMLGDPTLSSLDDQAFVHLRQIDDPQVVAGLALDPAAASAQARHRLAHADIAVDVRLAQLSDLLRSPALAPRAFAGAIASVALADMARREMTAAFRAGPVDHPANAVSPGLNREVGMMLYRKDGGAPLHWTEGRRHIGGLRDALRQIRAAALHGGAAHDEPRFASLDAAVSVLDALGRHFGVPAAGGTMGAARPGSNDPYWNDTCLADIAPFFGLRYEPSLRAALPLCGAMHRARLLAAVGMRMALPDSSGVQAVVAKAPGSPSMAQVDDYFRDAAYRRGELSLVVAGSQPYPSLIARALAAGDELNSQPIPALEGELLKLAGFSEGADIALTRLMSAVAQGADDFVRDARELPEAWRWARIPEPQAVRHIRFCVGEMPRGGYRLDVSACLETPHPDTEVLLSFAMHINATAGRVTSLIVPPEARLLPALAAATGNVTGKTVTTAGFGAFRAHFGDRMPIAAVGA